MTDLELEKLYREGLIPYEGESESSFKERALYCHEIKTHLTRHLANELPPFIENSPDRLEEATRFYGITPSWVPIILSNDKLLPWQGAAAWIFQLEDGAPLSALIQLRQKAFSLFGSQSELVTHEIAHIGRMGYSEKEYEELLAYRSSPNRLRSYLGPLFRSNFESIAFVSLLMLVLVFDFALLMSGSAFWYDRLMALKLIPLAYLAYLLVRLFFQQRRFERVLSKIGSLPLIYLLLDSEINQFSKSSPEEIAAYIESGKTLSLRRQLLALCFKTVYWYRNKNG